MPDLIHPSFGLVSRVRIGGHVLYRTTVKDAPWVRAAVPHFRNSVIDAGLSQVDAKLLSQEGGNRTRAALWAWVVARSMDAPEEKSRDASTLCGLHVAGMGLLLELGWPNVLIIEEEERVFHFRRLDGSPAEASRYVNEVIQEYMQNEANELREKR